MQRGDQVPHDRRQGSRPPGPLPGTLPGARRRPYPGAPRIRDGRRGGPRGEAPVRRGEEPDGRHPGDRLSQERLPRTGELRSPRGPAPRLRRVRLRTPPGGGAADRADRRPGGLPGHRQRTPGRRPFDPEPRQRHLPLAAERLLRHLRHAGGGHHQPERHPDGRQRQRRRGKEPPAQPARNRRARPQRSTTLADELQEAAERQEADRLPDRPVGRGAPPAPLPAPPHGTPDQRPQEGCGAVRRGDAPGRGPAQGPRIQSGEPPVGGGRGAGEDRQARGGDEGPGGSRGGAQPGDGRSPGSGGKRSGPIWRSGRRSSRSRRSGWPPWRKSGRPT